MSRRPLRDLCWARIVTAGGEVRSAGMSFWMSRRTAVSLLNETRNNGARLVTVYGVPVQFDDEMTFGHITLERRWAK